VEEKKRSDVLISLRFSISFSICCAFVHSPN